MVIDSSTKIPSHSHTSMRAHTHSFRVHAVLWSHSHGTADPWSNSPKDRTATETILVLADPNLELQIIHNSCGNCLDGHKTTTISQRCWDQDHISV